jgi:hypothetical protein
MAVSNEVKISFIKVRIQLILSSKLLYVISNEMKYQTRHTSCTAWAPAVCYYVRSSLPMQQKPKQLNLIQFKIMSPV